MEPSHLQELIQNYGYIAVLVGALLEGETILVMAGFAAHAGYLNLALVILIAALGGFTGDQFFFTLGRLRGQQIMARFPRVVIGVRFMYGLRVAGPMLLGVSHLLPPLRFAMLNLVGALLWATLIGGAGFLFGRAMEMLLADAKRYEAALLGALLLVGIGVWAYRRLRMKAGTE
jgi:membrane protein DedA with SNARE-associated domain